MGYKVAGCHNGFYLFSVELWLLNSTHIGSQILAGVAVTAAIQTMLNYGHPFSLQFQLHMN